MPTTAFTIKTASVVSEIAAPECQKTIHCQRNIQCFNTNLHTNTSISQANIDFFVEVFQYFDKDLSVLV